MNKILQERNQETLQYWNGYLYYFQNALKKLPDQESTVYRGIDKSSIDLIKEEYKLGRKIYWAAYTLTSTKLTIAKNFSRPLGVIFKIQVYNGKNISHTHHIKEKMKLFFLQTTNSLFQKN